MRTNIEIDDATLRRAQELLGTRTKRETVDAALREVVARDQRLGLLRLRGTLRWEGDLAASREGRTAWSTRASGSTSSTRCPDRKPTTASR